MYAQNNIFKKRILKLTFWKIYILVQISFFCELIFRHRPTMVADIFTQPTHPRYLDLVKDLYREPADGWVVGNLFNFVMTLPSTVVTPQAPVKKKEEVCIHYCFKKSGYPRNVRSTQEEENPKCYCSWWWLK